MVRKMLDRRRQIDWQLVRGLIGLLFSTAIIAISVYRFASLAGVQAFVRAHFGDLLFQLFFVIFVITAAGFLFYLRQTRRGLYAFIEITFGLLAGVYASVLCSRCSRFPCEGCLCVRCWYLHHRSRAGKLAPARCHSLTLFHAYHAPASPTKCARSIGGECLATDG